MIAYIKYNPSRKKEYQLVTFLSIKENKKIFYKKALSKSAINFVCSLTKKYKLLIEKKFPFKPIKPIVKDKDIVGFEYIENSSNFLNLLIELLINRNDKEFYEWIDIYYNLLNKFSANSPTIKNSNIFKFSKNNFKWLSPGTVDLDFGNLFINKKNEFIYIDYEWVFNFDIPLEFVFFRAIINLFNKVYFPQSRKDNLLIKLFDKYNITKYYNEFIKNEYAFQNYVNENFKENFNYLIFSNSLKQNGMRNDLIFYRDELNQLKKNMINLKSDLENLKRDYKVLQKKYYEFESFKKGIIWKSLMRYRKLKKLLKYFFKALLNPIKATKYIIRILKGDYSLNQFNLYGIKYDYQLNNNLYKKLVEQQNENIKQIRLLYKSNPKFFYNPKISILLPVYNVAEKWLRFAVDSVINQIYPNWELCIVDDASTNKNIRKILEDYKKKDKRIKVHYRKENGHISKASNDALSLATGEFVALFDHDDKLTEHALFRVVEKLNENPDIDFIYSDEDKINLKEEREDPFFKPDWSPDFLNSINYITHFSVLRKSILDSVNGFRIGYEGSQDYDLFLRITEKTDKIAHIPEVLYSWRKIPNSTSMNYDVKGYANRSSIKALEDSLKRKKTKGVVINGLFPGSFRIKYKIIGDPKVSIIIPTKNKLEYIKRCINSIIEKSTYKNYEIVIIDTGSLDQKVLDFYKTIKSNKKIKFLFWKKLFNYSSVNNFAVKHTKSDYVILLNNDTEVISSDWIESMLEHAQRKEVGAVGAKLLYPNNTIQHAGVILGLGGVAGHAFKNFSDEICGIPVTKDIIRNFSAVTAACLMISRKKFNEVGGLDEKFRIAFNDVDFCLKLRELGYFNVYTPYAKLYHHESISVGRPEEGTRDLNEFKVENDLMFKRWGSVIKRDPFYNKNLNINCENFNIISN